jgi:ABC-type uncharacterized transport system auxiliary subunit
MTRVRMTAVRGSAAALVACFIGACTSGAFDSDQPSQHVYVISAPGLQPSTAPVAVDLTVVRPVVRPGLDTDRIAVLYPDRRLEYFAGSRWGATTDVVVQALLVESLRNAGGLRNVQNDTASFGADFVLQSEVSHFQAQYGASGSVPEVRVELVVTIGKATQRRPVASFIAAGRAQADANTLAAVVAAFEAAYAQAAKTVVEKTAAAIQSAMSEAVPASAQNVESPVASISR